LFYFPPAPRLAHRRSRSDLRSWGDCISCLTVFGSPWTFRPAGPLNHTSLWVLGRVCAPQQSKYQEETSTHAEKPLVGRKIRFQSPSNPEQALPRSRLAPEAIHKGKTSQRTESVGPRPKSKTQKLGFSRSPIWAYSVDHPLAVLAVFP
jgi:hypothetical protein